MTSLIAINISKAGMGVEIPKTLAHPDLASVPALKGSEIILHVFPENIAKAIYEGQVLQVVIFSILFGIAVALLGRNKPLGVIAAAVLFGALHKGTIDLDLETENVTRDLSLILQALIIVTVSADGLWSWMRKAKTNGGTL